MTSPNAPPAKTTNRNVIGLVKRGTITNYDLSKGIIFVKLSRESVIKESHITVPIPHALFYNNELFIGALPHIGSTIIVAQGDGNIHYVVSFYTEKNSLLPSLKPGEIKLAAGKSARITLNKSGDVLIGDDGSSIHIDTVKDFSTSIFTSSHSFTQATRHVDGPIKRDLKPVIR